MDIKQSGIFLVNKPQGITSHDLIQKIKRKLNIKKIGHAGTLDPLATGLMVVLVNQATKISNYLLSSDKSYEVEMKLFVKTDTGDITGEVIETQDEHKISRKEIEQVIAKYNGYMYEQYPPIYSAVKVNGKKLYEYARIHQEEQVEIKPRTVTINTCSLLDFNPKANTIRLQVNCSKGTYIRSLVQDIAQEFDAICTVSALHRNMSGKFDVAQAKEWNQVQESDLISMYNGLLQNDHNLIEYHKVKDIIQGRAINLTGKNIPIVFLIDDKKNVLAIYKWVAHDLYTCQRGLWDESVLNLTEAEREF
ncbi:tRNA pseudouridine(55) synthase TruB [Spiroplasma culicicola]|uniref:tRNA pseudouridine synthase B n=1 Tax=Spiroplasma culicicola AES-1 TaxID=1276246 RepID=W6AGF5_9MOLU|nr:tRNA pseudouridine(55) synthase TruB [Spiroplasma culicicola]AHI52754.1 tRNA pseudouridine synthase B [Spiroplasma culicicola AES-1]